MNTLISTTEVLRRAFRPEERLPADTVREADVVVAEWRFVRPVLGDALHDRLLAGDDANFVQTYLADAVALLTRVVLLPRLVHFISPMGPLLPKPQDSSSVETAEALQTERRIKREAMTLLRRAVAYGAQRAGQDLSRSLSGGRIAENGGGGHAAAVMSVDPSRLTAKERQEIRRRVARGEKVSFN